MRFTKFLSDHIHTVGRLKEIRTLFDLAKNFPNELQAIPKDGVVAKCPCVGKLIGQMVTLRCGYQVTRIDISLFISTVPPCGLKFRSPMPSSNQASNSGVI